MILNETELEYISDNIVSIEDISSFFDAINNINYNGIIIVTLGENGVLGINKNNKSSNF